MCKSNILMKIKDYKILLLGYKNKHRHNNLFLEEFEQIQKIDESQIKCENCNNENKNKMNLIKIYFLFALHVKKIYVLYVELLMEKLII